jgi:alpha-tubulin suppressor-like RCC1 family protein
MAGFGSGGWGIAGTRGSRRPAAPVVLGLLAALLLFFAASAHATEELPKNTKLPSIGGTLEEHFSLNGKKGEWTGGGLTYGYLWERCETECHPIPGATNSEYTAQYADIGTKLRVVVTAKNKVGSAEATSAQAGPVTPWPPKLISAPVTSGTYQEDQVLSVSNGTWEGTPATRYEYEWERCNSEGASCKAIAGATEPSYRTGSEDVGHKLKVNVKLFVELTEPTIERNARSAATPLIEHGPPVAADEPAVSGELHVGGTLHAATGKWLGQAGEEITYAYSWERCTAEGCGKVGEAANYTVATEDVGKALRVTVTATNGHGSASSHSVETPIVLGSGEHEDFAVAWGEDERGEAGTIYRTTWVDHPVPVEGVSGIDLPAFIEGEHLHEYFEGTKELPEGGGEAKSIAVGGGTSFEVHPDGTITASGAGSAGTLGYGGVKATWEQGVTHVAVKGVSSAVEVSSGNSSAAALLEDGTVLDWGGNGYGILGNGKGGFEYETGENRLEPKEVKELKGAGVTSVTAGWGDRFALLPGGRVDAWGYNRWGQLGIKWTTECKSVSGCENQFGSNKERPRRSKEPGEAAHKCLVETGWELCYKRPAPVVYEENESKPLEHVKQIAAGGQDTYALLESGEVLSWGDDSKAQLAQEKEPGSHTTFTPPGPVMVGPHEPLTNVVAISSGYGFVLALVRHEGGAMSLYGWGQDANDELGPAAENCGKKAPACDRWAQPVSGPEGVHVAQIAAGAAYSAVLGTNGRVYTIGANNLGQLGRGPGCELGGGQMGINETCYSDVWQAVSGVEHVISIAAGHATVVAVVAPEAAQPLPVVGVQPAHQQLELGWSLPDSEVPESVVYRKWEYPGNLISEPEGENGGSGEGEEGAETETEEGTGVAPKNKEKPAIEALEQPEGLEEWVKAKQELRVGDKLVASRGVWEASPEPTFYEYTWKRCATKCRTVHTVGGSGEEANVYVLGEADIGFRIKVEVTAHNGVPPAGTAASNETETIKSGKHSSREVKELDGVTLGGLTESEYEVKLESSRGLHETVRTMVLRPGP